MIRIARYPHCLQVANFIRIIPDHENNHDVNGDDY